MTAGAPIGLTLTVEINGVAIIGALEAVPVEVEAPHQEVAVVIIAGITPAANVAGATGIQTIIIGAIGIVAVVAIHVAGQRSARRAANNDAGNGRACISTVASVTNQAADQPANQDACWVGAASAFAIIDIIIVAISTRVALAPIIILVVTPASVANDACVCRSKKAIPLIADPIIAARRRR